MNRYKEFVIWAIIIVLCCISTVTICTSCIDERDLYEKEDVEGTLTSKEDYTNWDTCKLYFNYITDTKMSTTADGEGIYWIIYNDIDAEFDNAVISMSEETFTILLEALDALQNIEAYSQEWNEICDEYEFVILYKGKTNILMIVDKD